MKYGNDALPVNAAGMTVTTTGALPEMVIDVFADALVQFIQACEAEDKESQEKSA